MGAEVKGIEIATARLLLRPLAEADALRIEALCGELAVSRWHLYPPGEAVRCIARSREADERHRAIEPLAGPGLTGVIGIEGVTGEEHVGYWLGFPRSRRRYAGEAARAAWDRAFGEKGIGGDAIGGDAIGGDGIGGLASGAVDGNAASLRVQERLGFRVTGRRMLRCEAPDRDLLHIDSPLDRAGYEARA